MTANYLPSYRRHGVYCLKNWLVNIKDLKLTTQAPEPREVLLSETQMAVLCYFSDHHRKPISSDELHTFLLSLNSSQALPPITLLITQLCHAFGQGQQLLQKLDDIHYMLTADPLPPEGKIQPEPQETIYHLSEFGRKKRFGFTALLILSAFLLLATVYRPTPTPPSHKPEKSQHQQQALLLVLPFDNSASGESNKDLSDGLSTLITEHLTQSKTLAVIARDSAFSYQNRYQNAIQIGTLLGATHVIKGQLKQDGQNLLLQLELLAARTDKVLWIKDYQGTIDQLARLCHEFINDLATALTTQLKAQDITLWQSTLASEQLLSLLQAMSLLEKQDLASIDLAVTQLQAMDKTLTDSGPVKRLLAKGLVRQYHYETRSKNLLIVQLSDIVASLKTTPPNLIELELSAQLSAIKGEQEQAQNQYLQLIDRQPNNSAALLHLGALYQRNNQYNEAQTMLEKAYRVNPNHHAVNHYLGRNLLLQGELTQAMEHMTRAIDARHGYPSVEIEIAHWYRAYGDLAKATQWAAVAKAKSLDKETLLAQALGQSDKTALNDTLTALKSAPGSLEDELFELASLHFYNGELAELKALLDSHSNPHPASLRLWLGYWQLSQSQFEQAISTLEPLTNQTLPSYWPLSYRFAMLNRLAFAAAELGKHNTKQAFLKSAEQEQSKLLASGLKTPLFVSEMAANLMLKGQPDKAKQILKNVAAKRWQIQQYVEQHPAFILLRG